MTIGLLVPQKLMLFFPDAATLLAQRIQHRQTLADYAVQRGLDRQVSFLGERPDIPELLHAAGVFWLTSAWAGLPNVLLETMACAKRIVTRSVGTCQEIVDHGVHGCLVPRRDTEQFVDHAVGLLTNSVPERPIGPVGRGLKEISLWPRGLRRRKYYTAGL